MQVNFIPLAVASSFAVLRDLVIRHLDPNSIKTDFVGSIDVPFDLALLEIEPKTLITVSKLLTKDHHLVTCLTPDEVIE
jgi:hypothetical protein